MHNLMPRVSVYFRYSPAIRVIVVYCMQSKDDRVKICNRVSSWFALACVTGVRKERGRDNPHLGMPKALCIPRVCFSPTPPYLLSNASEPD